MSTAVQDTAFEYTSSLCQLKMAASNIAQIPEPLHHDVSTHSMSLLRQAKSWTDTQRGILIGT
jgi:hypothetical protein